MFRRKTILKLTTWLFKPLNTLNNKINYLSRLNQSINDIRVNHARIKFITPTIFRRRVFNDGNCTTTTTTTTNKKLPNFRNNNYDNPINYNCSKIRVNLIIAINFN